jgi:F-type H+-transporting ATPase subunit a
MAQGFRKLHINSFLAAIAVLLICVQSSTVFAQHDHAVSADTTRETLVIAQGSTEEQPVSEEHESGKFNPGKMISEHISDAHDWHLWGHTHIPLPVILFTDKGFDIFSSANFRNHETHHLQDFAGKYYTYRLDDEKVKVVLNNSIDELASESILDVSITKNVLTLFIISGLMLFVFISVARTYTNRSGKAPRGLQGLIEPIILFIRDDIAKPSIGKKYERFMPYLLSVFFFILFANLLGLVPVLPGGANLTGNIAVTLTLAVITFIITTVNGNRNYWGHIFAMPGVPKGILLILTPIEILGVFLRPIVLMIRLFANITAGHIIALAFFSLIFIFGNGGESVGAGVGVGVASWLFTVFMMALELLVAFIQAYVFTLLSAIYFGSAIEESHHNHTDTHDAAHSAPHTH